MNREEGTYFLSHVYDPLLTSVKKIDRMEVTRESGSDDQI